MRANLALGSNVHPLVPLTDQKKPCYRLSAKKSSPQDGQGTSQSSKGGLKVKEEKPDPAEQRKMLAKLHYLSKKGHGSAKEEYDGLSIQGKRNWFFNVYMKDPSLSRYISHVQEKNVFGTEQSKVQEEWLTEKQIMNNNGYTDATSDEYQQVKEALLSGLDEREHEKPEMAKLGIKQYLVIKSSFERLEGTEKMDRLVTDQEISAKDAKMIAASFDAGDAWMLPPHAEDDSKVQLEPWKKEGMDLEKKLKGLTTKGDRIQREAEKIIIRLKGLDESTQGGHPLALAQRNMLADKLVVFKQAASDYFEKIRSMAPGLRKGLKR